MCCAIILSLISSTIYPVRAVGCSQQLFLFVAAKLLFLVWMPEDRTDRWGVA